MILMRKYHLLESFDGWRRKTMSCSRGCSIPGSCDCLCALIPTESEREMDILKEFVPMRVIIEDPKIMKLINDLAGVTTIKRFLPVVVDGAAADVGDATADGDRAVAAGDAAGAAASDAAAGAVIAAVLLKLLLGEQQLLMKDEGFLLLVEEIFYLHSPLVELLLIPLLLLLHPFISKLPVLVDVRPALQSYMDWFQR